MKVPGFFILAGTCIFLTTRNPHHGYPMAVTLEHPTADIDRDGIRDRNDLVIDFRQVSPPHNTIGLNVAALSWNPERFLTCLDRNCAVKPYSKTVTVPDGGAFLLFKLPADNSGPFIPWNAGNAQCQNIGLPQARGSPCWADLQGFRQDPLVEDVQVYGVTVQAILTR